MKKLPIGISTLSDMRRDDYVYIDKTHHVFDLVDSGGKYYFLSRPRRFGKSLFLDTIKQAFLANRPLFKDLFLDKHWDWNTEYPVLHFSFGSGSAYQSKANLIESIENQIKRFSEQFEFLIESKGIGNQFHELISKVHHKLETHVVILIDEYDKPISDVINLPDEAKENREILKKFYSVIKDNDAKLKFVLLTGVSKFSKVSLFSGLNNLKDISLTPKFADICGYTQTEMEHGFAEFIKEGNVDLTRLKAWYNGYGFNGTDLQRVYNPFDILLFCSNDYIYKNYWFETATPTFLIKLLQQKQQYIPNLESFHITDESLSSFDVDNIPMQTLLFQTGYLTIKAVEQLGEVYGYELSYPNLEVKSSLNSHLMQLGSSTEQKNQTLFNITRKFKDKDFDGLKEVFNAHFASIPHQWYTNNPMEQYEGFYCGIIYSCFAALGYEVKAEDATSTGRIDLSIKTSEMILIMECKLAKYGSAADAIKQIIDKNYAEKFKSDKRPIYLIGMSFDDKTKTMTEILTQKEDTSCS